MHQGVRENSITEGVIWKQLLLFFFPILFGTFFQQLYNTADAVIVGRYVGKDALAAVGGSTSILINLLVNLFVGISAGATVVVAQYYGAQRYEDVSRTVHTSMIIAVVCGAGMSIIGFFIAPFALRAMGTPAEIMADSLLYFQVYLLGIVASFIYNIGSAILRAVGDTKRPLYFLIVCCFINIALDMLFVAKFGWGVFGVAAATLIAQIVSAVLTVLALMNANPAYRLNLKELHFSRDVMRSVFRVGIPAGLQGNMYTFSNMILQSCINSFGTNTIAAWAAFGKLDGMFWMIIGAYGISITTFAGQNYGARQYKRIHKGMLICLAMAMGTAILFSILLCSFADYAFLLFISDSQVLAICKDILWRMAPYYFTFVCVEILAGTVRACGSVMVPMLMTCFGICGMRILWVIFVLPLRWEMNTIVISYPLTWAITSVLFIIYYARGRWMRPQPPLETAETQE